MSATGETGGQRVEKAMPDLLGGAPQVNEVVVDRGAAVHVARGFHLGNVIKVSTPEGAVVIDTTGGVPNASRARDALNEVSAGDAAYLVYTHCHNDHTSGGEAFAVDATREVIAQDQLPDLTERDMVCLGGWTLRHRTHQMGIPIDALDEDKQFNPFTNRSFVEPTLTFADALDVEIGGLTVHLEHTEGETRDHLLVWIPELGVLCPGDLVYASFPNLSTPAIGPRPIQGWLRSLERFLELEPDHLVGSHSGPVSGKDAVRDVLTAYRDAVQHVWDESVKAIEAGVPVGRAAREIRLPDHLATHPWLGEYYGTVNWGVRAVYDRLTGWYDFRPATLNPYAHDVRDAAIVEAAGAESLVARAEEALAADDFQLALELTDVVLNADPAHRRANEVQAEACVWLRRVSTSANEKGFYRTGELLAKKRLADLG